MTGTPLTSRPRDLFPLLQLVRHALGRSFVSFAKRYCDGYKGDYGWVADGASNIEELTVQLHGIMLRRTKAEVLDLPPKVRAWLEVEVASRVAREMSEAVFELLHTISRRGQAELEGETAWSVNRGSLSAPLVFPPCRCAFGTMPTAAATTQRILKPFPASGLPATRLCKPNMAASSFTAGPTPRLILAVSASARRKSIA